MRPKFRGPGRGDQSSSSSSRRKFLEQLSFLAGAFTAPLFPFGHAVASPGIFAFEEIPPEKSGITWVHTAGKSPEKYLPETSGAGCAFLDYDNDGWMDIYLINSGKCDFYSPVRALRNALYRNNRDRSEERRVGKECRSRW